MLPRVVEVDELLSVLGNGTGGVLLHTVSNTQPTYIPFKMRNITFWNCTLSNSFNFGVTRYQTRPICFVKINRNLSTEKCPKH